MTDVRPLPPGPVTHDDDGDPIPQPAENSDVRDIIQLMEYSRLKGWHLGGAVRVGKIAIERLADLRAAKAQRQDDEPDLGWEADQGINPDGSPLRRG